METGRRKWRWRIFHAFNQRNAEETNGHERSYNLTEELNMIAKLKGPQCESIIVRNVNAKYRIITWK